MKMNGKCALALVLVAGAFGQCRQATGADAALPPLFGDGVRDDTAAIQARLDSGVSCVYLPPPQRCYLISKALEVNSDQELRLDRYSVVRLAPKSDCHMVVNKNWRTGDRRIAVTGGIWDFNNLEQSPNPHMTMHCKPPYKTKIPDHFERDFFHGEIFTFDKVEGLELRGITLRNPTTYGIQMTRTSYFHVDDISLDYTTWNPSPLNLDGIHLDGGCHHGRISNVRGTALDDMVALNSADWVCSAYEGPIHDIDIVIENVFAAKAKTPEGIGSRERYPLILVQNGADVGNLSIRNFRRVEETYGVPSIKVEEGATVERLTVRDCRMDGSLEMPIKFLDILGKVGEKTVENNELLRSFSQENN